MFPPTLAQPLIFPEMEDVPEASGMLQPAECYVHSSHADARRAAGLPHLEDTCNPADISALTHEETPWAPHPTSESLLASSETPRMNKPVLDVDSNSINRCNSLLGTRYSVRNWTKSLYLKSTHEPAKPEKDVGDTPMAVPPKLPFYVASSKQSVLQEI